MIKPDVLAPGTAAKNPYYFLFLTLRPVVYLSFGLSEVAEIL
jgi:hypothetical protein